MVDITYTASRQVQATHTAGLQYTITIDLLQDDGIDGGIPKAVNSRHVALSGNEVNVLHRVEYHRAIVTDFVPRTGGTPSAADMAEFLASVVGGESFTIDDGSNLVTVVLTGNPSRSVAGVYYQYSINVRELT